jgi:hypothetical protein
MLLDMREEYHSLLEGFPCDRLKMEETPFIRQLLAKRPGSCWTVIMTYTAVRFQLFGCGWTRQSLWVLKIQRDSRERAHVYTSVQFSQTV